MDFDKLKRAAKETLKIVSSRKDETTDAQEPEETAIEPETDSPAEEKKDDMEMTQRIDLKNVLDIFKKKKFTDTDPDDSEADDTANDEAAESVPEPAAEQEAEPEETINTAPEENNELPVVSDKSIDELKQALDRLSAKLDTAADKEKSDVSDLNKAIEDLSGSISELYTLCSEDNIKQGNLSDAIISQLGDADKKLKNISNSISGISKLGDSIFDLKNSQMNTKNSLGNLEASFYKLKKKMNSSMLIISILTAIIAILEIINLLS